MTSANREYKDRLFTFIFGREEHRAWALSLYNAVSGRCLRDPSEIEVMTIREALYMGMRNDVSFLVANEINLYEQQSTFNPNMPLRILQYLGNVLERYVRSRDLNKYGEGLLRLPGVRPVVFYNGQRELPDEMTLRLSDAMPDGPAPDVEVRVRMVNVNAGHSARLLDACPPLAEYAWLVREVRSLSRDLPLTAAIDESLACMPGDFEIRHALMEHQAEVSGMLLEEYDEEYQMGLFRKDGIAEGEERGRLQDLRSLMGKLRLSAERAMELLDVPEDQRSHYLSLLEE